MILMPGFHTDVFTVSSAKHIQFECKVSIVIHYDFMIDMTVVRIFSRQTQKTEIGGKAQAHIKAERIYFVFRICEIKVEIQGFIFTADILIHGKTE